MSTRDKVFLIFRRAGHRLRCLCNWLALFPRCVLDWSTDNPNCDKSFKGCDDE